jgi:hypothetical protein
VHKRKRDGQIEKLARPDQASPSAPAEAAPPVTNGAASVAVDVAPPPPAAQ